MNVALGGDFTIFLAWQREANPCAFGGFGVYPYPPAVGFDDGAGEYLSHRNT